jgi:hypothetical protein
MVSQADRARLRQALLGSRHRAEVMHLVVSIGDKVAVSADPLLVEEWAQTREAFMAMLDS